MRNEDAYLQAFVHFFSTAGQLKRLKRQGWVDRGVDEPESVSDHSWRLALMTLLIGSDTPGIDLERAVILALVHDLPEALAGDVTPFDDRLRQFDADRESLFHDIPEYSDSADQRKTAAERAALQEMTADLPDTLRRMLLDAWEEYEAGETGEAQLVRQLDKLETWLQAIEYRREQTELIIESFRRGTTRDVTSPELVRLFEAISTEMHDSDPDDRPQ